MTDTAVRKPDFMRPAWWEIAERLCMARRGNAGGMVLPEQVDIDLAQAIVRSRIASTRQGR